MLRNVVLKCGPVWNSETQDPDEAALAPAATWLAASEASIRDFR
jgi:hypothetical protein